MCCLLSNFFFSLKKFKMYLFLQKARLLSINCFSPTVIGKGGEQITRLQAETGCKIQIAPGM